MHPKHVLIPLLSGGVVYLALAVRAANAPPPERESAPPAAGQSALPGARRAASLLDPVPPATAELSGTRLKAKYIQGADGSRVFVPGWFHDAELDVDCKFEMAWDDKLRCLPDVPSYNVVYLDDKCTKPVVDVFGPQPGCTATAPRWLSVHYAEGFCEPVAKTKLYIFEGTLLDNPIVYRLHQGVCEFQGQGPMFTLQPENPTRFVEGTRAVDP